LSQKIISKSEMTKLCQAICEGIGEAYKGPFTLEMDAGAGSVVLSLKGEKRWYKVKDKQSGVEVCDEAGQILGEIGGIHLPTFTPNEELVISNSISSIISSFSDESPTQSRKSIPALPALPSLGERLLPNQSGRDIIEKIAAYLLDKRGINSTFHQKDGLCWATIEIPARNMPTMRIIITSQVAATIEGTGKALEQVLIIRLFTRVIVPTNERVKILEKINSYHGVSWAGCFRIHDDAEIEGIWPLNLLESGVSLEQIWDSFVRLMAGWKSLFKELSGVD